MASENEAQRRSEVVFNAAADGYDDPALFWDRFGRRTVDRLELRRGDRVLDVCCGSGASALAAADRVGADGRVIGVDLADYLLALARAKAEAQGFENTEFRRGDMLALDAPEASFDAVVCVFGFFFVPDMVAAAKQLWLRVRPGGCLAVTTWGERIFEPADRLFWEAVREQRPDLDRGARPWERLARPEGLRELLREAGIEAVEIAHEPGHYPLRAAEAWWRIMIGSGHRGTVDALSPEDRERVRARLLSVLRERDVREIETNALYAVARKPAVA